MKRQFTCVTIDPSDTYCYCGTKTGDVFEVSQAERRGKNACVKVRSLLPFRWASRELSTRDSDQWASCSRLVSARLDFSQTVTSSLARGTVRSRSSASNRCRSRPSPKYSVLSLQSHSQGTPHTSSAERRRWIAMKARTHLTNSIVTVEHLLGGLREAHTRAEKHLPLRAHQRHRLPQVMNE